MTEDEAWELKDLIMKETGRLDVGVVPLRSGIYVCMFGTDVRVWSEQDWEQYKAAVGIQAPTAKTK